METDQTQQFIKEILNDCGRLTTKKDLSQVDSQVDREFHLINETSGAWR